MSNSRSLKNAALGQYNTLLVWLKNDMDRAMYDLVRDEAAREQIMAYVRWVVYLERMTVHGLYGVNGLESIQGLTDAIANDCGIVVGNELTENDDD